MSDMIFVTGLLVHAHHGVMAARGEGRPALRDRSRARDRPRRGRPQRQARRHRLLQRHRRCGDAGVHPARASGWSRPRPPRSPKRCSPPSRRSSSVRVTRPQAARADRRDLQRRRRVDPAQAPWLRRCSRSAAMSAMSARPSTAPSRCCATAARCASSPARRITARRPGASPTSRRSSICCLAHRDHRSPRVRCSRVPSRSRRRSGATARTSARWGPRTIDIDLIAYDDVRVRRAGSDPAPSARVRARLRAGHRSPRSRRTAHDRGSHDRRCARRGSTPRPASRNCRRRISAARWRAARGTGSLHRMLHWPADARSWQFPAMTDDPNFPWPPTFRRPDREDVAQACCAACSRARRSSGGSSPRPMTASPSSRFTAATPTARPIVGRTPGAPWQVMSRIEHPDPAAANAQALHDLENGATGLSLVFAGSIGAYRLRPRRSRGGARARARRRSSRCRHRHSTCRSTASPKSSRPP